MIVRMESRVRARARLEQRFRRVHEAAASRRIETEISREAEMRERVPVARAALRGRVPGIQIQKASHRGRVAEYRRRMDVADLRVQDGPAESLRALEGSRRVTAVHPNARRFDEPAKRVIHDTNGRGLFSRFQRNATYAARRRRFASTPSSDSRPSGMASTAPSSTSRVEPGFSETHRRSRSRTWRGRTAHGSSRTIPASPRRLLRHALPGMVKAEARAVIDQPQLFVRPQEIRVLHRPVGVLDEVRRSHPILDALSGLTRKASVAV